MALWTQVLQLQGAGLRTAQSMYGAHFPIEVRQQFGEWIEDKIIGTGLISIDPATQEPYITQLTDELINTIETKAKSSPKELQQKLTAAASSLKSRHNGDPLSVFKFLRHCLSVEQCLVAQITGGCVIGVVPDAQLQEVAEIVQLLTVISQQAEETGRIIRGLDQERQTITIQYHELQEINAYINKLKAQPTSSQTPKMLADGALQKNKLEKELVQRIQLVNGAKADFLEKIKQSIDELDTLQTKILSGPLDTWKRQQQLAGNGLKFNDSLDTLQLWCEDLAELVWNIRLQLKACERVKHNINLIATAPTNHPGDKLPVLQEHLLQLLSALVSQSFIVETQPPQVMKTLTKFSSSARLLVGGRLNIHMASPEVTVSIISEEVANGMVRSDKAYAGMTNGKLLNNNVTMEYVQSSGRFYAEFRNLKLDKIVRKGKKGGEFVTEEKFCLRFQTDFKLSEGELKFQIWTHSVPVVVIVHGSQEEHGWATIFWDNAFSETRRLPFAVPDSVPWSYLAHALNVKFTAETNRSLSAENLQFLAEKFCHLYPQNKPDRDFMVRWTQFFKDTIPGRGFTLWEWFYSIMKLTKEQLRNLWKFGCVEGLISRQRTEKMLLSCQDGTFLLRFGESEKGGIAVAWVETNNTTKKREVVFLLLTSKDLGTRSLADRVLDIPQLQYLHPNIPKVSAFGKYSSHSKEPSSTKNNGYVDFTERMILNRGEEASTSVSLTTTPTSPPISFLNVPGLLGSNNNGNMMDPWNPQSPSSTYSYSQSPSPAPAWAMSPASQSTGVSQDAFMSNQVPQQQSVQEQSFQDIINSLITDGNLMDIQFDGVQQSLINLPYQGQLDPDNDNAMQ